MLSVLSLGVRVLESPKQKKPRGRPKGKKNTPSKNDIKEHKPEVTRKLAKTTNVDVGDAWDRLPAKKQLFIRTLHENGWNKTQAALTCGAKNPETAQQQASNWLKEVDVQMGIEIFARKFNKADNLTIGDLKSELWKNHMRAARVSDSNKALELICRLLGAFKDSIDIEGKVGIAQVLADLSKSSIQLTGPDDLKPMLEDAIAHPSDKRDIVFLDNPDDYWSGDNDDNENEENDE